MSTLADPMDITSWTNGMPAYLEAFEAATKRRAAGTLTTSVIEHDPMKVYVLLKRFITPRPNGLMTKLAQGKPLQNVVWWDFVFRYENTFLEISRTVKLLQGRILANDTAPAILDLNAFIEANLKRYGKEVDDEAQKLELHSVFINHYQSYRRCAEWAHDEIQSLDLQVPADPMTHVLSREAAEELGRQEEKFLKNSHKFHVLAKSLVLHSAFMIEAFVNNLLRIGAAPPLRISEAALRLCMRANFKDKLKVLRTFTIVLRQEVDTTVAAVQGALEVMELRNKYVHADEGSMHNRVGEVRFDGDFPLFPVTGHSPGVEFAVRAYHNPDLPKVNRAYQAARTFIEHLSTLLLPQLKDEVMILMEQSQLGFNESKRVYSAVFVENPFTFFVSPA